MLDPLRVVIVGLGNQGRKRKLVAGSDLVATIDPLNSEAQFQKIEQVALDSYDAALVCTPEDVKIGLLRYLLSNGKHVLVEKPLLAEDETSFSELTELASSRGLACYTAYNHRFEPAIFKLKDCLSSGEIGEVYQARLMYGNGTARDVRNSLWRDADNGVLTDLGSHLLDLTDFLFGIPDAAPVPLAMNKFENRAFDHCVFSFQGLPFLEFEVSLLSWRNAFSIDVVGSTGSAHVNSLVKWGPSSFTARKRVLPSGRPDEVAQTWTQADPTWRLEYKHFKELCTKAGNSLTKDRWIDSSLKSLVR